MRIVEFSFVVYPATDLARSRAFYEGVLGLTSASSCEDASGFWVEYEIGPHTLAIGNRPFMKPSGDGPHLVLEMDDFERTVEHLRHYNVQFVVEPFEAPGAEERLSWIPTATSLVFTNERHDPQPNQALERTADRRMKKVELLIR
jgi:catechol 2,3-dioxygenase-like lactoylglutathione lyase family enzyme